MTQAEIDQVYRSVGELVRKHRKRERLTQQQLADAVSLSRTSITNLEKGRQHIPLHVLFSIAHTLHLRPEALIPAPNALEVHPEVERALFGRERGIREWATRLVSNAAVRE